MVKACSAGFLNSAGERKGSTGLRGEYKDLRLKSFARGRLTTEFRQICIKISGGVLTTQKPSLDPPIMQSGWTSLLLSNLHK